MSKKRKKRRNTPLKQHKQQGRKLSPPFMTIPNMKLTYWLKDDLPDMLWLCYLCTVYGDEGPVVARKVFNVIEEVLVEEYGNIDDVPQEIWVLGKLTSIDEIPIKLRPEIIERLKRRGIYDNAFPKELAVGLSRYSDPPAKWLWGQGVPPTGYSQTELDKSEKIFKQVVEKAWSGYNDVSTWAKMAVTSAMFSSGRIKITSAIADVLTELLPYYPKGLSDEKKREAESRMRAMYQGLSGGSQEKFAASIAWAKQFWRENWQLYACESSKPPKTIPANASKRLEKYQKVIDKKLKDIKKRFLDAAKTDPDLYEPERYEVLTGLVSRMMRAVELAVGTPTIWSTEHGSGLIRSIVEVRIILAWLISKDDPELYKKFQNFGRGHLKLLKLHLEEYLDKQAEPSPDMKEYIEQLDQLVNQDIWEEFQDIQARGNFAGNMDTRKMADAVGLGDDYRFIFAPASSNFHGEWTAVDQFALERCINPLHKGHRVARKDTAISMGSNLIELALDQLDDLVQRYIEAISPSTEE